MKITYGEKRISGDIMGGAWQRYVTLEDGRIFNVSITRGRSVRIAYKPRGQNRGFEWWAYCSECKHDDGDRYPTSIKRYPVVQCNKSTGVRGILKHHNILTDTAYDWRQYKPDLKR